MNETKKVTAWISSKDAERQKVAIGGLGGFFADGMRWKDYIEIRNNETRFYAEAIRKDVQKNNIRITGQNHQELDNGVPLFDDGKVGTFSYRAWGDLMAAIWSEAENKDYRYMDFYMKFQWKGGWSNGRICAVRCTIESLNGKIRGNIYLSQ